MLAVIPIGGQHITHDLAIGLKTDLDVAEKVKIAYGSLLESAAVSRKIKIEHDKQAYEFDTARIYDIIVPRFEEILEEVDKVFARAKRSRRLPGGVVLTGGVAQTPGLAPFATEQLQLHTRIGKIQHIGGLADTVAAQEFATAIGLMMLDGLLGLEGQQAGNQHKNSNGFGVFTKIKNLVSR